MSGSGAGGSGEWTLDGGEAPTTVASAVFEYSPDAILVVDGSGIIVEANPQAGRLFGYPDATLTGLPIETLMPERFRAAHSGHLGDFFRNVESREMGSGLQLYGRRRDGAEFPVDVMLSPLVRGGATMGIAIVRDITDRKRAEAEVALVSAVFAHSPDAILVVDDNGLILEANRQANRVFGYGDAALVGLPVETLMPDRFRAAHAGHMRGFFRSADSREMGSGLQLHGRREDGKEFPVDVMLSPLVRDGRTMGIAIVRDITDRKRVEAEMAETLREKTVLEERAQSAAAVRKANEVLAKVIDGAPLAIIMIDGDDRISLWNPAAERIYRLPAAAAIGRLSSELLAEYPAVEHDERASLVEAVRASGGVHAVEAKRRRPDGSIFEISASASLLARDDGEHDGIIFMAEDITGRRAMEAQLRQSQRVEAIGQLTGGVAHDFNNILAIIHGNLELIRELSTKDAETVEMVDDALKASSRGASLTHRLLAYSRQQQLAPGIIDIEKLVLNLVGVLRRLIEATVAIETAIQPGLWSAHIDPNQLESALINLAVNARDAMPRGGRLTISAENATLDEDYAAHQVEVEPGNYVTISVSDTGGGMSKEVVERALEPFFTTKPVGHGTGLGLSMVFGFIKQSGGHLRIYSEVGHGTTIKLYLPKAPGSKDPAIVPEIVASKPRGDTLILVVEDDESVRRLQVRILNQLGYRTLEAGDGATGLALAESTPGIAVLLTDIVLPQGMSGPELAAAVRDRRPATKIVFMSGYAPNAVLRTEDIKDAPVLSKPFTRVALAETLQRLLENQEE